jgi:LPS-assembly lipoprotein
MSEESAVNNEQRFPRPALRAAFHAALLALSLALAGCGFHLRAPQPLPFESIYVALPTYSELGAALKRNIRAGGNTRIVDTPEEAQAVLAVVSEVRERSILSLNASGRVRELQLRYRFAFRVHDNKGTDFIPPTTILLTRDLTYDDSIVLAKTQEEEQLYRDMQNDLVQQLLRRLAAAKLKPAEG